MRLLFIDTETGGVDAQIHALLSIGLVVWDAGRIIAKKEILVKSGKMKITRAALHINKIDYYQHENCAVDPKIAIKDILEFVKQYFNETKAICAGHNIGFDIAFLKQLFRNNNRSFDKYFSHRYIDTSSILSFLYLSRKLSIPISSSSKAFEYYNVKVEGRHTALGDALATVKLFEKLLASEGASHGCDLKNDAL